jgi:hypothetical protein
MNVVRKEDVRFTLALVGIMIEALVGTASEICRSNDDSGFRFLALFGLDREFLGSSRLRGRDSFELVAWSAESRRVSDLAAA